MIRSVLHRRQKWGRGGSAATPIISRRGSRSVDDLQLREFCKAFLSKLRADARLLGPAERDVRRHVEVLVDPDRAGLDAGGNLMRAFWVGRPDRGAEAVSGGVGAADYVFLVGVF